MCALYLTATSSFGIVCCRVVVPLGKHSLGVVLICDRLPRRSTVPSARLHRHLRAFWGRLGQSGTALASKAQRAPLASQERVFENRAQEPNAFGVFRAPQGRSLERHEALENGQCSKDGLKKACVIFMRFVLMCIFILVVSNESSLFPGHFSPFTGVQFLHPRLLVLWLQAPSWLRTTTAKCFEIEEKVALAITSRRNVATWICIFLHIRSSQ